MLCGYDWFVAIVLVLQNKKHIFGEWPGVFPQQIISFIKGTLSYLCIFGRILIYEILGGVKPYSNSAWIEKYKWASLCIMLV